MKKILAVISKDIIRRNIYDTDFWSTLVENNKDNHIHLVVEKERLEYYQKYFTHPNVTIHGYTEFSHQGYNRLIFFLVRSGLYSHSTQLYRMRAYKRADVGFFQMIIKEVLARTLGRSTLYKRFVRFLVSKITSSDELKELFETIRPDIVFAPSLIDNDFDVPVSVEARRRKIPVVGMVRSWDNLNNHGVLAFVPDRFIVQNVWLQEVAHTLQGLPKDFVKDVSGLPHYDRYKEIEKMVMPRDEFFQKMNLDPNKKYVFLAGFDFYYSEDALPATIDALIESGEITEPTQVLFTRHPRSIFSESEYKLDTLKHVKLYNLFGGKEMGFHDTESTFMNLGYHADVIINMASTVAIDAAIFDKPTICIDFDAGDRKLSYWEHVHRLYDSFDHYERLVSSGGVSLPKNPQELAQEINAYYADPTKNAEGRKKIIDFFVAPFDGVAGKRLASMVQEEIDSV